MFFEIKIILGFAFDLIFGDPQNFPHPVRIIGNFITKLEEILYKFKNKKFTGFILMFVIVFTTYILTLFVCSLNPIIEVFLIYTIFATKTLGDEGIKIYKSLKQNNIELARTQLGYIVSRDTENISQSDIVRGTIESISENLTDGIISPLFFLLIGGVPLAMAFKAASTLDSMVGYKNDRYIDFGFASAKFDDILNFIPARLTGFVLIPLASLITGNNFINSLKVVFKDRLKTPSPNSGHSEAGFAGALGVRLGGASTYFGKIVEKPTIGVKLKDFDPKDIIKSVKLMYFTSILALMIGMVVRLWF
ncbi:MAG: cobalamin biosynthesis protein CobD [Spirochaetes bacterium GWC1_27_15]|nr:MAG: cobalamin biosynthesis protein CobD [Spirochaetes bacterium GWB1_27_13]OHD25183.1 MAG: cobalamin biosynthesis protein CobD [Spirochaetes bacterium GWC1_27_15]